MAKVLNCGNHKQTNQSSSKEKHPKIKCLNVCDELTTSNESISNVFFIEAVKELPNNFKSTEPPCDEFDHDHTNSFYIK